MPCNKSIFRTEKDALIALERLKKNPRHPNRVYLCHCGGWHLTTQQLVEHHLKKKVEELEKQLSDMTKERDGQSEVVKRYRKQLENARKQMAELVADKLKNTQQINDEKNNIHTSIGADGLPS